MAEKEDKPASLQSVVIPRTNEMVDDEDCPYVLTYRDSGPNGMAPGGGWPSAFALFFQSYIEARDYWDRNSHLAGRFPKVDLLPLKRPAE